MTVSYATVDDYELYADTAPADIHRLLERASELIDDKVRASFAVDADTNLPTDEDIAAALRDAVCAQVEYWTLVGEELDIEGQSNHQVGVMGLSVTLSPELAPRAVRFLKGRNLMSFSPQPRTLDQVVWP